MFLRSCWQLSLFTLTGGSGSGEATSSTSQTLTPTLQFCSFIEISFCSIISVCWILSIYFLSKSKNNIIIGTKNDPELDKPVIEALEALDDKEKGPGLVAIAEVEPEVGRESKMANNSSQGAPKTFKNLKHSSPARKFNIFGKNVVKIIVF